MENIPTPSPSGEDVTPPAPHGALENVQTKHDPDWTVLAGSLIVSIAILVASWLPNPLTGSMRVPAGTNNPADAGAAADTSAKNADITGEPFIGKQDAPLTLIYWFDFQCPFCKKFETESLSQIIQKYVDTGKVKVVFKDFQFLGPDSQSAGIAAHAIWDLYPDKYFAWQTAMFNAQDNENGGFGNEDSIIQLTRTISGIDADRVKQRMAEYRTEYQQEMDADKQEGQGAGITGTPGFLLNGKLIVGAQPAQTFIDAIEAALKK